MKPADATRTRPVLAFVCLLSLLAVDLVVVSDADAIAGARRRTARRTAIIVSSAHASETEKAKQEAAQANEEADAAKREAEQAKQDAAAAEAEADRARADADAARQEAAGTPAAGAGAAQPIGRIVPSLPEGCTPTTVDGVEYYHCGPDYYRAAFQGSQLVYVTARP